LVPRIPNSSENSEFSGRSVGQAGEKDFANSILETQKPIKGGLMVEAVLFDFGQTLVDSAQGFRKAEKKAEMEIFEDLGVGSWEEFLSSYRRFRQELHARSNFSRRALWQQVYRHYDRAADPGHLLKMERDYWEMVRSKTRLFPETEAVLERLVTEYRLAMITNTQGQEGWGKHRLSLFPELERFFEVVIVAGEAGVPPKPNPEPFLMCLQRLGIGPHEAVYVGDDWRIDMCGAQAVGIQPVWLQHHSVTRKWPAVETAVPIIISLEQLPAVVRQGQHE
jgi:HAD superfamily hydrolase (TIGR01549 family)